MAIQDLTALEPLVRARMLLQGTLDVEAYLEKVSEDVLEGLDEQLKSSLSSQEAARAYERIFEDIKYRTATTGNVAALLEHSTEARHSDSAPDASYGDLDLLYEILARSTPPSDPKPFDRNRLRGRLSSAPTVGKTLKSRFLEMGRPGRHERKDTTRAQDTTAA
jgi:hypothetical protein